MAVKIRLRQQGRTNRQTYRLVVTDIREPRGGKYLEMIGWYNPFSEKDNINVNAERATYWLDLGAEISDQARSIIKKVAPEVIEAWTNRRQEKRKKEAAKRRALKKA